MYAGPDLEDTTATYGDDNKWGTKTASIENVYRFAEERAREEAIAALRQQAIETEQQGNQAFEILPLPPIGDGDPYAKEEQSQQPQQTPEQQQSEQLQTALANAAVGS